MHQSLTARWSKSVLLCGVFLLPQPAVGEQRAEDWAAGQLALAGENRDQIAKALADVPTRHAPGLKFLVRWMPERDLRALSARRLLDNVRLAYEAREQAGWRVPDEIFFNDVLPYAVATEARDPWRSDFRSRFSRSVADCSTSGEAALLLNQAVFDQLQVHYHTARRRPDQSPRESIEQHRATCTGLAILLIDACRAVGVPARFTGVFNWSDDRGNHSWVEIWDSHDQAWHFLGADEPDERGLDHAWFVADAARATPGDRQHAIWASSWKPTGKTFPLSFAPNVHDVHAIEVTDRYARPSAAADNTCRLFVKTVDSRTRKRTPRKVRLYEGKCDSPAKTHLLPLIDEGTTRGERADLNDMLTFKVARGEEVTLSAWLHDQVDAQGVTVPDRATFEIVLNTRSYDDPILEAEDWFAHKPMDRELIPLAAMDKLLMADPVEAREIAWQAWLGSRGGQSCHDYHDNRVTAGAHTSPYTVRPVGDRPDKGWPLVIAMHGGGNTTQEINDRQWEHMQVYYKDHPEVSGYKYLALRAPNNDWNGFYADYVYPLIDQLLRNFTLYGDIDRDRVYLIGYSHGGYGAFAIGPKMPDRFAAIHSSAAAPTDGETTAKTLRTTRFTHMVGEEDHAYGRADRNQRFAEAVRVLRGERQDIYPVEFLWEEGHGHSGLPDRDFLVQMLTYERDPLPKEVYWAQTDSVIKHLFWLADDQPAKGREVLAKRKGNKITLESSNVDQITLLLDSRLVDFSQPVEIVTPGGKLQERLKPSAATLLESIENYADPGRAASCKVTIDL